MSADFRPRHKEDFAAVYDLPDPRPYFRGLGPAHYRMPDVLGDFLRRAGPRLAASRSSSRPRLLDFACGYGTNGALLRLERRMDDLYRYFATDAAAPGVEQWPLDRAFFDRYRRPIDEHEIGGVDIAATALDYAARMGFIDRAFAEDLGTNPASPALREFMAHTDIVIESGSIGPILHRAFEALLEAAGPDGSPWFLYCPRPDVDWSTLAAVWKEAGYAAERCNSGPIRYRKPLGERERQDMLALARAHGIDPERVFGGGYLLVDLVLARPAAQSARPTISSLAAGLDELWR